MPEISKESKDFLDLVEKDMVMNIWRYGKWGSFRHIPKPTCKAPISFQIKFPLKRSLAYVLYMRKNTELTRKLRPKINCLKN